jgi:hypothetical protein
LKDVNKIRKLYGIINDIASKEAKC